MPVRDETEVLAGLPPVATVPVEQVREALARQGRVVVVLDDDPTGTQTVADVPVLTTWSVPDIRWAMRQDATVFYVLTNSRSLDPADALRRTREVMDNVCAASRPKTRLAVSTGQLRAILTARRERQERLLSW